MLLTIPPPHPSGMPLEALLALVISVATGLMLLVGWFINRTLTQVETAIQASNNNTAGLRTEVGALRSELGNVKADLKDYAGQVQRQSEELGTLKLAYAALQRAFNAMDKWLYGQAMQGKLPQPPDFKAAAAED